MAGAIRRGKPAALAAPAIVKIPGILMPIKAPLVAGIDLASGDDMAVEWLVAPVVVEIDEVAGIALEIMRLALALGFDDGEQYEIFRRVRVRAGEITHASIFPLQRDELG